MSTESTIESPRPEAPPYNWPNQDLKNLVTLAPMSPYTRALLRIKYNRPVPDNCTTFEQIEAWLATLPTAETIRAASSNTTDSNNTFPRPLTRHQREQREIDNDEYVDVEAKECGYSNYTRSWEKSDTIRVPLSVWEQGVEDVEEYVRDKIERLDENSEYSDYEYNDQGDSDFEIEDDLDDLMEEAQTLIRQRDGEQDGDE